MNKMHNSLSQLNAKYDRHILPSSSDIASNRCEMPDICRSSQEMQRLESGKGWQAVLVTGASLLVASCY